MREESRGRLDTALSCLHQGPASGGQEWGAANMVAMTRIFEGVICMAFYAGICYLLLDGTGQ